MQKACIFCIRSDMSLIGPRIGFKQSGARVSYFGFFAMVFLCSLCGCSPVVLKAQMDRQKDRLYDRDLSAAYDQTRIKKSLTLDVLPRMGDREGEIFSQGETVVASLGRGKDGYKTWFTMVAFHEFELSVIRKYFFVVDEKVEKTLTQGRGFRFDCEMFMSEKEIGEIQAAKEAKQTTVLKAVLRNLEKDVGELAGGGDKAGQENKTLDISVLLIKNVGEAIIRELEMSGVLATKISDPEGIEFDHINFGKGRIRIWAEGNIAVVKIRLGALVPTFHELQEAAVEGIEPPARQVEQPVEVE